jgi:hypothetical protein
MEARHDDQHWSWPARRQPSDRVPYQAWGADVLPGAGPAPPPVRAGQAGLRPDRPDRAEQDNEQWHLLILQDLAQRHGLRQSFVRHRLAPWLIALVYYHVCWLLFLVAPEWSYRLNADFEDHAEHEYMGYVAGRSELDAQPDPGSYAAEYGRYGSVADLLRQIGHDERIHKLDSLANMRAPRFCPGG